MLTLKKLCFNYCSVHGQEQYWAPFIIDKVKGTFGKRGSSHSESNHSSVKTL